jgi:hypothetical protein
MYTSILKKKFSIYLVLVHEFSSLAVYFFVLTHDLIGKVLFPLQQYLEIVKQNFNMKLNTIPYPDYLIRYRWLLVKSCWWKYLERPQI